MNGGKSHKDWGCIHWFILAFLIFCLILMLTVMVSSPSGGRTDCQSMFNIGKVSASTVRVSPFRGDHRSSANSQLPTRSSVSTSMDAVKSIPSDVRHTNKSDLKKPAPVRSLTPLKPSKAPKGASGGVKVDVDVDDCD